MRIPVRLPKSGARRGAISIGMGVGAGQLVIFAVSPVLTRLYTPADFGQYAILVAILAVLTIPATLRLEAAIPLADSDAEARDVLRVGLISTALLMVTVSAVLLFFTDELLRLWPNSSISTLWCIVPGVAAFAAYELMTQFAVRQRRYGAVGLRSMIQNGGVAGGQVALGFAGVPSGLNWGQIFGKALAVGFLVPMIRGRLVREHKALGLTGTLRKFSRFPLLAAPSSLFNTLGTQAPYLLIGVLFGSPAIGFLGLIQRLVAAPQALVGQAVGQVYVGEVALTVREGTGNLVRPLLRATRLLLLAGVPMLVAMLLIPDSWLVFVFGAEWSGASKYVQAVAFAFVAQFVVAPVSQTLILSKRQDLQLIWDVLRLVFVAGMIFAVNVMGGTALQATWAYSIASGVSYLVLWALCKRTAHQFTTRRTSAP